MEKQTAISVLENATVGTTFGNFSKIQPRGYCWQARLETTRNNGAGVRVPYVVTLTLNTAELYELASYEPGHPVMCDVEKQARALGLIPCEANQPDMFGG